MRRERRRRRRLLFLQLQLHRLPLETLCLAHACDKLLEPVELRGNPHGALHLGLVDVAAGPLHLDVNANGPLQQRRVVGVVDGLKLRRRRLEIVTDGLTHVASRLDSKDTIDHL